MLKNTDVIEKAYYSIGEAAAILGIDKTSHVRLMEKIGAIHPHRGHSGYFRSYTLTDIQRLRIIYDLSRWFNHKTLTRIVELGRTNYIHEELKDILK